MQYIKDLLNKIKWSEQENPADYSIGYWDNVQKNIIFINFNEIKKINGTFIVIEKNLEDTYIPVHRIKIVKKRGKTVWKR